MNKNTYRQAMDQVRMPAACEQKIMAAVRQPARRERTGAHRPAVSVMLGILILLVLGFTAYALGGYELFRSFFLDEPIVQDMPERYTYLDFEQLADLEYTPAGRLVDDDAVRMDVVAIIGDENVVNILLDVTLKKAETVRDLRLEIPGTGLDAGMFEPVPLEGGNLPANSARFLLGMISAENLSGKTLSLHVTGLGDGAVDPSVAEKFFTEGYTLPVPLQFSGQAKTMLEDEDYLNGKLLRVLVSPLSCVLEFDKVTGEKVLQNGIGTSLGIHLKSGQVLDWRGHLAGGTGERLEDRVRVVYSFKVPLNPADIAAISFEDVTYPIEPDPVKLAPVE